MTENIGVYFAWLQPWHDWAQVNWLHFCHCKRSHLGNIWPLCRVCRKHPSFGFPQFSLLNQYCDYRTKIYALVTDSLFIPIKKKLSSSVDSEKKIIWINLWNCLPALDPKCYLCFHRFGGFINLKLFRKKNRKEKNRANTDTVFWLWSRRTMRNASTIWLLSGKKKLTFACELYIVCMYSDASERSGQVQHNIHLVRFHFDNQDGFSWEKLDSPSPRSSRSRKLEWWYIQYCKFQCVLYTHSHEKKKYNNNILRLYIRKFSVMFRF